MTQVSVGRVDPATPEPITTPPLQLDPAPDLSWLARAATLPPPRPAPIAGVAAPIDPEFPQLQPNSPQLKTLRETLTTDLFKATGGDPAKLVDIQQAVERLTPALAQTTQAGAQKLISAELKRLVPDAEALKVTLKAEGFSGPTGGVMSRGNPTAEAFSGEMAKHLITPIRLAQLGLAKEVTAQARNSIAGAVRPEALKIAFQRSMHVDLIGQNVRGFPARSTVESNLVGEMRESLMKRGVDTQPLAKDIEKLASQAADALFEANVKGLVAAGFTEASARAYTLAPSVERAGAEVGKALYRTAEDLFPQGVSKMHAPADVEAFFARQAREGFVNLGKNLITELKVAPTDAEKLVKQANALWPKELAKQKVPASLVDSIAAMAAPAKPVLSNPEGAAKLATWGDRVLAAMPAQATNAAKATGEAAAKFVAANPTLAKALPYVGRLVPYVNTPIAGLTLAHAAEVHLDPAAWKMESLLADGAAGLNVLAAGSAYAPIPVLDWAASFTGGAVSLGVSGLEWGTSSLRKALAK